jgi:hypothetical protein
MSFRVVFGLHSRQIFQKFTGQGQRETPAQNNTGPCVAPKKNESSDRMLLLLPKKRVKVVTGCSYFPKKTAEKSADSAEFRKNRPNLNRISAIERKC